MKTYTLKNKEIKREWHLIDLKNKILGREATLITALLIGKNKSYYSPHLDCGDYVVAVNAQKIKLTGKKEEKKIYYRHSNYPGGLKKISFRQQKEKDARKIIYWAVKNMLPKNKLRDKRLSRLKVFNNEEHPYADKFSKKQ